MKQPGFCLFFAVSFFVLGGPSPCVADWPTYRADNQRSGVSAEELAVPLHSRWTFHPRHAPRHAWPRTFRENAYTGQKIRSLLTFDHAFHTVAADHRVFFGSSADHKIYCLDTASGHLLWEFFTEGPVRMAPTIVEDRVYAGADDGYLYCLTAATGELVWKHRVGPTDERLPGNEQWISRWPVRSGVAVEDDVAYAAAGLFPHREGSFLCAVDARTGKEVFTQSIHQVTQGYLLASKSKLCIPAGKLPPSVYDRHSGSFVASVNAPRGTFALISEDVVMAGPGVGGGEIAAVSAEQTTDRLATFPGNAMIVRPDVIYLLTDTSLHAISRSEQLADTEAEARTTTTWKRDCPQNQSLIMAGNLLLAGGNGSVAAIRASDGQTVWTAEVDGRALGLAVADGNLLVSTDRGSIYCFGRAATGVTTVEQHESSAEGYPASDHDEMYADTAQAILAAAPQKKGYCLVLGCGDGRLAYEIATRSELMVVGVESDPRLVANARRALDRAGLYGTRVVVHQARVDQLPYGDYLFNLIVCDPTIGSGKLPSATETFRLLRPFGLAMVGQPDGLANDALSAETLRQWAAETTWDDAHIADDQRGCWVRLIRGRLPGSGDWSHQYADPGNTASSDDQLVHHDLKLHWFGRPGPYRMFDRHSFTAAPVSVRGRLFTLGERVLFGQDAYNGMLLWTAELPELAPRVNLPRDSGFMAANGESVFVAAGPKCLQLDAATGRRQPAYEVSADPSDHAYDWGYVAVADGLLFGSGVPQGSFFGEGRGPWYDDSGLGMQDDSRKVLSHNVFAFELANGQRRWQYDGVVINSTLTLGGGRLYFVENRHPDVRQESSSSPADAIWWKDLFLVALDAPSGDKLWEQELHFEQRDVVFYLAYKDEVLVSVRSSTQFDIIARNARTGSELWAKTHGWLVDNHGGHRRHPVILDDVVFQQPQAYDLHTGEERWKIGENGACGTLSGSKSMLFCRVNYPRMYDLRNGGRPENIVEVTRPGCWINIIPAGGLVLMPEAGSGCSCEFPLHATMAFLPQ